MPIDPSEARELSPDLEPLARLAQRTLGHMSPEQSLRGERAVELVFSAQKTRNRWLAPLLVGATLVGVAALLFALKPLRAPAALSYVVESGASVTTSLDANPA